MATFTPWIVLCFFLLQFFSSDQLKLAHGNELCSSSSSSSSSSGNKNMTNGRKDRMMKLYPLIDEEKVKNMLLMNETRRNLGSFQVCAPCTCCGGGYCLPSPCCYAITCNLPGRPFGFCSFMPKVCNCFGCQS